MNNTLRDSILQRLAGSSKDKPVNLDDLRDFTADVCTDIDELDDLLDQLVEQRIVNTVNGFSGGRKYRCYWLTGNQIANPMGKLTAWPPIPIRPPITAKLQPKTSSPQTEEPSIMTEKGKLPEFILALVKTEPGIDKEYIVRKALAAIKGATEKQVRKAIDNMVHVRNKLRTEGPLRDRKYFISDSLAADKPKRKPSGKKKSVAPTKSPKPRKSGKHNAPRTALTLAANGHPLHYGFNLDGSFTIHQGPHAITLPKAEAVGLMMYGRRQMELVNQTKEKA